MIPAIAAFLATSAGKMVAAQGISSILGASIGARQMRKSKLELAGLKKEKMPSVLEAAGPLRENIDIARQQYERGIGQQSIDLARQQNALDVRKSQRYFQDISGGQMSSAASRLGAMGTAQTGLGLASMNIAARQRGMSALISGNQQMAGLMREDAANRRQYRMALEQQLGYARSEGRGNIVNAVQGAAMGVTNYAMGEAGFFGGGSPGYNQGYDANAAYLQFQKDMAVGKKEAI